MLFVRFLLYDVQLLLCKLLNLVKLTYFKLKTGTIYFGQITVQLHFICWSRFCSKKNNIKGRGGRYTVALLVHIRNMAKSIDIAVSHGDY